MRIGQGYPINRMDGLLLGIGAIQKPRRSKRKDAGPLPQWFCMDAHFFAKRGRQQKAPPIQQAILEDYLIAEIQIQFGITSILTGTHCIGIVSEADAVAAAEALGNGVPILQL